MQAFASCLLGGLRNFASVDSEYLAAQTVDPWTNKGHSHALAVASEGTHGILRLFPALHMDL